MFRRRAETARELRAALPAEAWDLAIVDLMYAGANDYVMKDRLARLIPALEHVLHDARLARQRLEAQAALKLHSLILAHIDDAVVALDGEDHILYWNGGAERLYGLGSDEVLGHALDGVLEQRWPGPAAEDGAREHLEGRGAWSGELDQVVRKHDAALRVATTRKLVRDEHGSRVGTLVIARAAAGPGMDART